MAVAYLGETSGLTVLRSDTGKIEWRTLLVGQRVLAHGDCLFVTAPSGPNNSNVLNALDARTGQTLWSAPAASGSASYHTQASSGRVLWQGPDATLLCAEGRTGKKLWEASRRGSPLGLSDQYAYLQDDPPAGADAGAYVVLLDARTGQFRNSFPFRKTEASGYDLFQVQPVPGSTLMIGEEGDAGVGFEYYGLRAFDHEGRHRWDADLPLRGPRLMAGRIIGEWWQPGEQYHSLGIAALDTRTGEALWRRKNSRKNSSTTVVGSYKGNVLTLESNSDGLPSRLSLLETRTGKRLWSMSIQATDACLDGANVIAVCPRAYGAPVILDGYRLP